MKFKRIALVFLLLFTSVTLIAGCGNKEATETEETTTATVQRGDLSLDISAVGNLALSTKESLAFELAGTVEEVLVEEGDTVEEGQVLAKLDTSERQSQLETLEKAIETKEQALLQAEESYQNAEAACNEVNSDAYLETAIAQAELAVAEAEISLASAQDAYDAAEDAYNSNWTVPSFIRNYDQKSAQLAIAELNLDEAEESLASVNSDVEEEREDKATDLTIAEKDLEDAQSEVDDAKEDYDEAVELNWDITAPYDGFITNVNISEGSEVGKNTAAIEIADPDEFEADVYVSEMDIFNVAVGTSATVQVDAAETVILPAEVSKVAHTATIQSGVVNYEVKVKIQSLESIAQEQMSTMREEMGKMAEDIAAGELPERLKEAVEAGEMTQEEAEEMLENMQSGNFPSQSEDFEGEMPSIPEGEEGGFGFPSGDTEGFSFGESEFAGELPSEAENAGEQVIVTTSGEIQLREGLTVTVSIITEERNDVLLVPSAAIHTTNGQTAVTVINADGTEEERAVEAGLSDWQNTEILSGLSEGEQVVSPITSSSTTTQSQDSGGFSTFTIPGMGGMR